MNFNLIEYTYVYMYTYICMDSFIFVFALQRLSFKFAHRFLWKSTQTDTEQRLKWWDYYISVRPTIWLSFCLGTGL